MNESVSEQQVREIVKSMISQSQTKSQYDVTKIQYHLHNSIDSPTIPYLNITEAPNTFIVAATTTGTTPVNVFPTGGAKNSGGANFNFTTTGVFLASNDTTAGNISLKNKGSLVTTGVIAKGTVAGVLTGGIVATGTVGTYTKGNTFQIVSSSVGNATVYVTFTLQ